MQATFGLGLLIALGAVVLLYVLLTFNRLVGMRNGVKNAFSDIDVQLERRHDLVPNLVESVRGYMNHERETLEEVTRARAQAMAAGGNIAAQAAAEVTLTGAVGNLLVKAERYPELKASRSFLLLQEQITSTENRIAFARQHYNEQVRDFNTTIATFPHNIFAGVLGFTPAALFAADAGDRSNVKVAISS